MSEYIERAVAVTVCDKQYRECLRKSDFCGDTVAWNICADIKAIPAADVAPVVHGRWVLLDECYNEGVYCSACHKKVYKKCYANQKIKSKFCPHCGAKMDGGAENG